MINRIKKKKKTKRNEVHKLQPTNNSELPNQLKHNVTTTEKIFGDKQRQSRSHKKMKSSKNRSKIMWQRSKSVPPKTVSFSPYVLHRFAQGPTRVKTDSCRNNTYSCCRVKTAPKKTTVCKKKLANNRAPQLVSGATPCMSSEKVCTSHENLYKSCESPGPSKCVADPISSEGDYNPDSCSRSSRVCGYGHLGESPGTAYHSHDAAGTYPSYNPGNSCSASSAYNSDVCEVRSPWFPEKRSRQCSPVAKNYGADAKYDFLMAKYSEHNCPKTHPARADYFTFQRHSRDGSQNHSNLSLNKSPSAWLPSAVSGGAQVRSCSRSRTPTMCNTGSSNCSLRSPYCSTENKYSLGLPTPSIYPCQKCGLHNCELYQSEAMRDLMYDSLSNKFINNYGLDATTRTCCARSDSDLNARLHMCRSPKTSFFSTDVPCSFNTCSGVNRMRSNKYDFADDMKLSSTCYVPSATISLQTRSRLSKLQPYAQRSRSTDSSCRSCPSNYNSDKYLQCKYDIDYGGDTTTSSLGPYTNWKKSYERFDNKSNIIDKFGSWKNTHGRIDDIKPSLHFSRSNIMKSCCSNNSNEIVSNLNLVPDSKLDTNSSWYDKKLTTNKRWSEPWSYQKPVDKDAYRSKFDEPERLYSKYTSWCGATLDSDQKNKRMSDDTINCNNITNTTQDPTNMKHGSRLSEKFTPTRVKDFTSHCSLMRDRSLSPVFTRHVSSFNCANLNSYKKGRDLNLEPQEALLGCNNSESLVTQDRTTNSIFPVSSQYRLSKFDTLTNFNSSSPLLRSSGNSNLNQSYNSGSITNFQPTSGVSMHNVNRTINSCTDNAFTDQLTRNESYIPAADLANTGSYNFNSSTDMLNSLVNKETDRLMKLADVIQRQKDITLNGEE